jgi:hypothetical protein
VLEKFPVKYCDNPTKLFGNTIGVGHDTSDPGKNGPMRLEASKFFLEVHSFMFEKPHAKSRHNPSMLYHVFDKHEPDTARHALTEGNGPNRLENQFYELEVLPWVLDKSHVKFGALTTSWYRFIG